MLALAGAAGGQTMGGEASSAEANKRLLTAVFNDDLDAVKVSIAQGADIEARSKLGRNAVELAIDLGHFRIAHYLLALRHHRRTLAARQRPPTPAPPPPFVPAEPAAGAPAPSAVGQSPAPEIEGAASPAAEPPPATPAPSARQIPAPEIEAAPAPPAAEPTRSEAAPRRETEPPAELGLGISLKLGQDAASGVLSAESPCVEKSKGAVRVCVLAVEWPAEIESHFLVDGFLYRGVKALVRFENGAATRLYAQFPSESFAAVSDYHQDRLGSPTEVKEHETRLQGSGKVMNQVLVWKRGDAADGRTVVLEIRKHDDVRRNTAARFGVIQVYYEGSGSMFSQLSGRDLMRLR